MKKATSIKEIKQVFRFNDKYLDEENQDFFENLYKKDMKKLEIDIEDSEIHYDTFYITGQSGNGKSTAVNQLKKNPAITDIYDIHHIFANDLFDFPDEVTIVDILLMIGISLVESNKNLQEKYLNELNELKNIHLKKLEKSIQEEKVDSTKTEKGFFGKAEIGFLNYFTFGGSFKREYSDSEQNRTLLRTLFLPNRKELLTLINGIIKARNSSTSGKKLLLIIDDLEKKNLSKDLFTKDKDLIEKIEVLKIVMIPVNYATSGKVYKLSLRLTPNPITNNPNDTKPSENKILLKNLVYKRIDEKFHHLIPDESDILERLIELSGGNIRQLLRLISDSATFCRMKDGDTISKIDVDEALQELLNLTAIGVNNKQSFLKYILNNNIPNENEEQKFKESIADNSIFAYFNGQPWYEVNPVIKDYIQSIKN